MIEGLAVSQIGEIQQIVLYLFDVSLAHGFGSCFHIGECSCEQKDMLWIQVTTPVGVEEMMLGR